MNGLPARETDPTDEPSFEAGDVELVRVGDGGGDDVDLLCRCLLTLQGGGEQKAEQNRLYDRRSHGSARVVTKKNVTKLISAGSAGSASALSERAYAASTAKRKSAERPQAAITFHRRRRERIAKPASWVA